MSSQTQKHYQTMSPSSSSTSALPAPQSSALPPSHPFNTTSTSEPSPLERFGQQISLPDSAKVKPHLKPLLRLEIRDLSSEGARAFLRLIHASRALEHAVDAVLSNLYAGIEKICIPGTRSVTLVLRDMDGVAYTTGRDIDDDHKEIHLSTRYIAHIAEARQKEEIMGVLVHEMVHCWQHSGFGSAPVGLTEGVADWVRLKAGYAPPHWKRHSDCDWDAGYERTGYFLEWLEKEHGADVVRKLNEGLRGCKYDAHSLWHDCCGNGVKHLWDEYKKCVECEAEG